MASQLPFIDLQAQRRRLGDRIDEAVQRVLAHGRFVMGPEIEELEQSLCAYIGATHGVACANGTDALQLPLMAWGIGPGDAVFCPAFTFASTAEVIALMGATPVLVDVLPDTFNIDPDDLNAAIEKTKSEGALKPRAIIAVDLFGLTADYPTLRAIADRYNLKLIADSAQGFGATLDGKHALHWADVETTSFFPAKPLGCYGDGGAMFTNDDDLASLLTSLRNHGIGEDRYDNVHIGLNSRLDTIQAAILNEKFAIFPDEIVLRNQVADRYSAHLQDVVKTPVVPDGYVSVWAQYTICASDRDGLRAALSDAGAPTAVYYPRSLHQQGAYAKCPIAPSGLAVSVELSKCVLSLPMHPYLGTDDQDRIISVIQQFGQTRRAAE
ncbi:MAG: DegT/DnrJ/EryC1/StrS aminotransferase family protein [Pseudomonadota bacterium]